MSEGTFRKFKVFAVILFACAFMLGGLLGYLSLRLEERRAAYLLEVSTPEQETTASETTAAPTEALSPEEKLYREHFETLEDKEYVSYEMQDLDGNSIPEMVIYRGDSIREVATIRSGTVVSLVEDYDLFLCENAVVGRFSEGSGGCTVWFYQISGAEAKCRVCLVWLFHEDTWYTSNDYSGDWDTLYPICDADRIEILSRYHCVKDPRTSDILYHVYRILEEKDSQ